MVEFIGPAGVDKTFLSQRVLEALWAKGIAARSFADFEISVAAPRTIASVVKAACLTVMTKPRSLSLFVRSFRGIFRYSSRRDICDRVAGIHITCEGLFHRNITLHRNSRWVSLIQLADRLFRWVRPPDVVVVVEGDAETVFDRRSARNRAHDVFSPESVRDDLAMLQLSLEAMDHIQRKVYPRLCTIRLWSDEGGVGKNLSRIVSIFEQFALNPTSVAVAST
jgi:hypothetical protein